MKAIIKSKLYDTRTAKFIGDYDNSKMGSDLFYYEENLYKKKTGEFFIYAIGGAGSAVAEQTDGLYVDGSKIYPITEEEAKEWVELHLSADTYIELFGPVSE